MNNTQLVNKLLDQMEGAWGRSPATCYKYRQGYRTLLGWMDKPLTAATTHDLELFLNRRPAAPSTTAWELAILRTLFGFLHEHLGLIGSNPAKRLVKPKVHNENPKPVPDELWRDVWASPLHDDERVALGLGYFCGLRRHEVTGLHVRQFIDVPVPLITEVKRKGGKRQGMRWQSCIALYQQKMPDLLGNPDWFNGALLRLRNREPHQTLLPWRETPVESGRCGRVLELPAHFVPPDTFNDRLRSLCTRLGLAERAITPHMLRHSFGTNLCTRARVPVEVVARLMGHTNVRVTMRYVEVGQDPLADFLAEEDASELRPMNRWGR